MTQARIVELSAFWVSHVGKVANSEKDARILSETESCKSKILNDFVDEDGFAGIAGGERGIRTPDRAFDPITV